MFGTNMTKRNSSTKSSTKSRPPAQLGLQLAIINRPTFHPSRFQEDIFHFCVAGKGDGLIVAAAGAGKTTTLVEVAQLLRADKTLFLAFNRSIADELRTRLANTDIGAVDRPRPGLSHDLQADRSGGHRQAQVPPPGS